MTHASPEVVVVGEVYVDHVMSGFDRWPAPGEEVATDAYTREIGGGAATTACALARLGRSVGLLAPVGELDAPWFAARLEAFGVAREGLRVRPGFTGVTLSVSTTQDRSFFTHVGVNGDLGALLAEDDALERLALARHVHFAMPLEAGTAARILPTLRDAGVSTSLDMGWQPAWIAEPANAATLRAVDHLLPNEKEAALLCGDAEPRAYLEFARAAGMRNGLLKMGAFGAGAWDGAAVRHVPPPRVCALDTTGAGDAFDAGFIDSLLDGADVTERLRRACICGALSTRAAGALGGLPDRTELRTIHERTYGS